MQSGAIRHILEIKKKDWTKKLMMFDKKNSWNDNILEINVAISQKKITST